MLLQSKGKLFIPSKNSSEVKINNINFEYEIVDKNGNYLENKIVFEEKEYLVLEEEVVYTVYSDETLLGMIILSKDEDLTNFQKELTEYNDKPFLDFLINVSSLVRKYADFNEAFVSRLLSEDIVTSYINIDSYIDNEDDELFSLRKAILEGVIVKPNTNRIIGSIENENFQMSRGIFIDCAEHPIASLNGFIGYDNGYNNIESMKREIEEKYFVIKDFDKEVAILKSLENKPFKSERKYQKNFFRGRK